MNTVDIVYRIAPEFNNVAFEDIESFIEMVKPLVSKKQFGKLYDLALAYLACHKMKLSGFGEENGTGSSGSSKVSNLGGMFGVASISDGGTSISFNSNQGNLLTTNAEYTLTMYGSQYLQLQRMAIVPIRIVGGRYDD